MTGPLVSVITPVFNSVHYVRGCITSVLEQDYPYIEHILMDGGSTDGTIDILAGYHKKYPDRVKYVSEPDGGACDAWNNGWRVARGEILGWLGADDCYEPDAVSSIVDFFVFNPGEVFVFGGCKVIDNSGRTIITVPAREFKLKEAINGHNGIVTPAAFYRREVIERVGELDTSINTCDYDYWIRVAKVFPISKMDKILASFRIHGESVSGSRGSFKVYLQENYYLRKKHGGRIFPGFALRWFCFQVLELIRIIIGRRHAEFYYRHISPILLWWRKRN